MQKIPFYIILLSLFGVIACQKNSTNEKVDVGANEIVEKNEVPKEIANLIENITPFFKPLGDPVSGDWLESNQEEGQTFKEYINGNPTLPTKERQTIYIQPIGKFTKSQEKIIKLTAEYLGIFYDLPVKLLETRKFKEPMSLANRRTNKLFKNKQIRTGYILDDLLAPNLPKDAAVLISFTSEDLYPNKRYNYLFGQASLKHRVGVWSIYRLKEDANFELLLKRTMKIAVHETGHMFTFYHCTKFSCAMNGTNHIQESDRRPIDFCPDDTAKIIWMRKSDAKKRYARLAKFVSQNGLNKIGKTFRDKSKSVSKRE